MPTTWVISMILTAILLSASWFHRHHAKPADNTPPQPSPLVELHDRILVYGVTAVAKADSFAKSHSELQGQADKVHSDVEKLIQEDPLSPPFPADLNNIQDEVEHMEGEVWVIEHLDLT